MRKLLQRALAGLKHEDVVIRRDNAHDLLLSQLLDSHDQPRFTGPKGTGVVYTSTLVDCAGNLTLARETAEAINAICRHTRFEIRLLSKYPFFPQMLDYIDQEFHQRLIFGQSTGTLDDKLGTAIEAGTALVSKRIKALHWLQDNGFRTFGMICPSFPQAKPGDYLTFAKEIADAIRVDRCEHIWAEVINVRGKSFTRTMAALTAAGHTAEAARLATVCGPKSKVPWEEYARLTFQAHTHFIPAEKLRFLQYVKEGTQDWWQARQSQGAVLLGKRAHAPTKGRPLVVNSTL
jgi:DNA repair photolyase